jgi:hypothetical protein
MTSYSTCWDTINEHDVDALCYLHQIFDFSQKMERAYLNHFDKLDDLG